MLPSYYEAIRPLPDGDRLALYDAIMDYAFAEKEPEDLSSILKGYFALLRPNIDSSVKRYAASVENGRKGGRPKKEPSEKPDKNLTKTQQKPRENQEKDLEKDLEEEKEKSRESFAEESKPLKLAKWLDKQISERSPHYQHRTELQLQKWARTFDLMNRRDGIPWDDIRDVLVFSQQDPFWQTNILSAEKFRKQFVQLGAKMDREAERRDG